MGEGFINLSRLAWLFGIAILVMATNVLVSVLYMVVYAYVIDPGHDQQYYDAHVQIAAPYSSIIAGIPLMFLAGYWISGWWGGKFAVESALFVWLVYALIDVAVLMAVGATTRDSIVVAFSLLTKLVAVYFGAVIGARSHRILALIFGSGISFVCLVCFVVWFYGPGFLFCFRVS